MFEVGDKIGDVEVVARLRAGGMAALYLGRREGAGGFAKDIAIKVVHAHLADDKSFVEMFVDEARLSARIDHPNVVRVEALREHETSYCLLMEFVHGCSLGQLIGALKRTKRRLSPELAVAIAIRVADGLHAAHELINPDGTPAEVVHRDVSPANVLVGYRGDVKLIDFGIAKATQRLHQTEAAGLKGKIAYMSPEQAFGRDVDRRTDVYALAIVLWEMLTTRRLFKADNDLRLLDMVREPKVVPPGALVPGLPPELDRVVLEGLAPSREGRPVSTRAFRQSLLDALPAAAAIDPLQISAVVCQVMEEKITEDRALLSVSSSFNALPSLSGMDSVTVSRLLRDATADVEVSLDQLGHNAEELAPGYTQALSREAAPTVLSGGFEFEVTPTTGPTGRTAPVAPTSRSRRWIPAVIGVAAVVGLLLGGGFGAAFGLFRAEPVQTIRATPLSSPPTSQGLHPSARAADEPLGQAVPSASANQGAAVAETPPLPAPAAAGAGTTDAVSPSEDEIELEAARAEASQAAMDERPARRVHGRRGSRRPGTGGTRRDPPSEPAARTGGPTRILGGTPF